MPIIDARKVVKLGMVTNDVPTMISMVAADRPTIAVMIGTKAASSAPNAMIMTIRATPMPISSAFPPGTTSSIAMLPVSWTSSPAARAASATCWAASRSAGVMSCQVGMANGTSSSATVSGLVSLRTLSGAAVQESANSGDARSPVRQPISSAAARGFSSGFSWLTMPSAFSCATSASIAARYCGSVSVAPGGAPITYTPVTASKSNAADMPGKCWSMIAVARSDGRFGIEKSSCIGLDTDVASAPRHTSSASHTGNTIHLRRNPNLPRRYR